MKHFFSDDMSKYRNYKNKFAVLMFTSLVVTGIIILIPYIEGKLIDSLVYQKKVREFLIYCIILAVFGFSRIILSYITTEITIVEKQKIYLYLNRVFLSKLHYKDSNVYTTFDATYLQYRISSSLQDILSFKFESVVFFTTNLFVVTGVAIYFFVTNKLILLSLFILIPAYILLFRKFDNKIFISSLKLSEEESQYESQKNNFYNRMIEVKSQSRLLFEISRLRKIEKSFMEEKYKNFKLYYFLSTTKISTNLVFQITFFLLGGVAIINGYFSIGVFTVVIQYFSILIESIDHFFSLVSDYQKYKVALKRINEIEDLKNDVDGKIELKEIDSISLVNFNYAFEKSQNIYTEPLNVTFCKRKIYSITGKNGAGKTTLLFSLIGLYKNGVSGEIIYNNYDIQEIDTMKLRKESISVMLQNSSIDNIVVKEYIESITTIGIFESLLKREEFQNLFLSEYFNIYDHLNKGINKLSLGERQMVFLLLTILKRDSKLYIFDEPTSNLNDSLIEPLKEVLNYLSKETIVILISHDQKLIDQTEKIEIRKKELGT